MFVWRITIWCFFYYAFLGVGWLFAMETKGGLDRTWRRRHAYGACIKVARGIPSLLVLLADSILLFLQTHSALWIGVGHGRIGVNMYMGSWFSRTWRSGNTFFAGSALGSGYSAVTRRSGFSFFCLTVLVDT